MLKVKQSIQNRRLIKELKKYDIRWDEFYSLNNIHSKLSPIEYFVKHVNKQSFVVPNVLDVEYYLKAYPDVDPNVVNPLLHYLKHGKQENRKAFPSLREKIPQLSEKQIKHDFSVLAELDIDWRSYIKTHALNSRDEAIAHYVTYWPVLLPNIEGVIDTKFYIEQYSDIWGNGDNPLVHFITHGKSEGRQSIPQEISEGTTLQEQLQDESERPHRVDEFEVVLKTLPVNWQQFADKYELIQSSDPIKFILESENKMKLTIPGYFDGKLYLELYPDIAKASISPLRHFLMHGKAEGRIGYFNVEQHFSYGQHKFDQEKALYVVVSHESSATGAPLVGFNLSQQLSKKYNIINIVLSKNKLQSAFESECIASISDLHVQSPVLAKKTLEYIARKFKSIEGIICNSVETAYVLEAANELNIPSVSLVHEFSEYTRPVGKITNTIFNADRVIVPAQVIKDSMCRELESYRGIKVIPNNIAVQPQGCLPFIPEGHGNLDSIDVLKKKLGLSDSDDDCHILVGAGYVQIRKGVDLFIAAAKRIKELSDKPCKFVWVGEGYQPKTDLNYSNWLQTQITLNGLNDDVVFLGHQRNLDNVMELADVFCMTSRLDPFPNVVIDALSADIHVACFEQSTGCAQFLIDHNANATVADYLDVESFSINVAAYLNKPERFAKRNSAIVEEYLDFDKYTLSILQELRNAETFRNKVKASVELVSKTNMFEPSFYDETLPAESALREYVRLGLKGIHLYNPAPGFNERKWLADKEKNDQYKVALAEAIEKEESQTHLTVRLNDNKLESIDFKYAVHLHLFYPDLATEFAKYFSNLPKGFDIFITHLDEADTKEIKEAFDNCGADKIFMHIVENAGRDVAPFIDTMRPYVEAQQYEVIGHFHSKKSLEVGGDMGDRWRRFLLDTLIGNTNQSSQVMSQFNNKNIGLVFAEDRHCVDSGENIDFIEEIYEELGVDASSNCYLYPLGTMFWARSESLKPLLELPEEMYQLHEPLPYDGSYLHAIERILPVCNSFMGYKTLTVTKSDVNW